MANIIEAAKWMQEGKHVCREATKRSIKPNTYWRTNEYSYSANPSSDAGFGRKGPIYDSFPHREGADFALEDLLSDDWQIVPSL